MAPRRPRLTRVVAFTGRLYRQKALLACAGYLGRDPMAQLQLRPGRVNPYAVYDRLRASGPLTPTRLGHWVSTSHSVCESVLRDRRFAVRPENVGPGQANLSFLSMNPPDHTRLRRLAMPAFSPKAVAGYTGRIERTAAELLDPANAAGRFDLVSGFAAPLPIAVITDLLGIPDSRSADFARYGMLIGGALGGITYDRPDTFDIMRPDGPANLAFSSGIHYCLGHALARSEAAISLRMLAERMPDLAPAGTVKRRNATIIRGPVRLPVKHAPVPATR